MKLEAIFKDKESYLDRQKYVTSYEDGNIFNNKHSFVNKKVFCDA